MIRRALKAALVSSAVLTGIGALTAVALSLMTRDKELHWESVNEPDYWAFVWIGKGYVLAQYLHFEASILVPSPKKASAVHSCRGGRLEPIGVHYACTARVGQTLAFTLNRIFLISKPRTYLSRQSWSGGSGALYVSANLWVLTVLLATYSSIAWAMLFRPAFVRRRRRKHGLCTRCGYNLRGSPSGKCPECGTDAKTGPTEILNSAL